MWDSELRNARKMILKVSGYRNNRVIADPVLPQVEDCGLSRFQITQLVNIRILSRAWRDAPAGG
jgi:hypothetical protein